MLRVAFTRRSNARAFTLIELLAAKSPLTAASDPTVR
jgi:hypothetical protein